jgi:hypothetical protein
MDCGLNEGYSMPDDDDADRVGACLKECRDVQKTCQTEFTGGDLCDQNHRRCNIECHEADADSKQEGLYGGL